LILGTAGEMKVPMPATAAAFQVNSAEFGGKGGRDFSIVVELMENTREAPALKCGAQTDLAATESGEIHDQSLNKKIAFHSARIQ
jgi:hypothetical protein